MHVVARILTYNNSALDCALNYLVLVLALVPLLLLSMPPYAVTALQHSMWLCLLVGLFALQFIVCFVFDEVGISLVWSAIVGYVACSSVLRRAVLHFWFIFFAALAITFAIGVWAYYAVADKPMTTVAHMLAMLLGLAIAFPVHRPPTKKPYQSRDSLPLLADDPLRHLRQSGSDYSSLGSEIV